MLRQRPSWVQYSYNERVVLISSSTFLEYQFFLFLKFWIIRNKKILGLRVNGKCNLFLVLTKCLENERKVTSGLNCASCFGYRKSSCYFQRDRRNAISIKMQISAEKTRKHLILGFCYRVRNVTSHVAVWYVLYFTAICYVRVAFNSECPND